MSAKYAGWYLASESNSAVSVGRNTLMPMPMHTPPAVRSIEMPAILSSPTMRSLGHFTMTLSGGRAARRSNAARIESAITMPSVGSDSIGPPGRMSNDWYRPPSGLVHNLP